MVNKALFLILMPALLFSIPACSSTPVADDNKMVEEIVQEPDLDGMAMALSLELKKGLATQTLSRQVMALCALANSTDKPVPADIEGAGKVIEAFFKNQNEAGAIAPKGADEKKIEWQSRLILYPLIMFEANAKAAEKPLAFQEKLDKLKEYITKNNLGNAELSKEDAEQNLSNSESLWIEDFNLLDIKGYQEANRLVKNLFYAEKTDLGDKGSAHAYIGNIIEMNHWDYKQGVVVVGDDDDDDDADADTDADDDAETYKASYAAQAFALNIINYCRKLKALIPPEEQKAPTLDAGAAIPVAPMPEAETDDAGEDSADDAGKPAEDAEDKPAEGVEDKPAEGTEDKPVEGAADKPAEGADDKEKEKKDEAGGADEGAGEE